MMPDPLAAVTIPKKVWFALVSTFVPSARIAIFAFAEIRRGDFCAALTP
jgi:hypothetical protein